MYEMTKDVPEFYEVNFDLVNYTDLKGESRPMYEMTRGWSSTYVTITLITRKNMRGCHENIVFGMDFTICRTTS